MDSRLQDVQENPETEDTEVYADIAGNVEENEIVSVAIGNTETVAFSVEETNVIADEYSRNDAAPDTEVVDTQVKAFEEAEPELRTIPDSDEDLFSQSQPCTPLTHGSTVQAPPASLPVIQETDHLDSEFDSEPEHLMDPAPCPRNNLEMVDTSQWRFVLSNLSSRGKATVPSWVASLACRGIHSQVDATVTHIIVSTEENLEAVRTLKYLQGIASGILVVSELWVTACLRDSSCLGEALRWEVRDEELEGTQGPRLAREAREQRGSGLLLAGFEVLVRGQLEGLARPAVTDLLTRVGARTVTDIQGFSFSGVSRLQLIDSVQAMESQEKEVVQLLRAYKVATVEKDWLLDTICGYEIKPISGYSLPGVGQASLIKAGYRKPLLD
jgi:hypothetical protein